MCWLMLSKNSPVAPSIINIKEAIRIGTLLDRVANEPEKPGNFNAVLKWTFCGVN